MTNSLSKAALTRTIPALRAQMGKSAAALEQLVGMVTAENAINLATALAALYPGVGQTRALANLRQLRSEIKKAAEKSGVLIELAGDKKTRTPAAEQLLWFAGEDHLAEAIERQVAPNLTGPARSQQDAIQLGPKKLYVVYSAQDETDAQKLLALLRPHGKTMGFEFWHQKLILSGENREEERLRQRKQCDLTLHLLSPNFQAERLDDERTERCMPVLLHNVADSPEDIAVFTNNGKCFSDDRNPRDFALRLAREIQAVLDKRAATAPEIFQSLTEPGVQFVPGFASPISLRQEIHPSESGAGRRDAVTLLNEWLEDPKAPPYCALFGELGMGKTTTAKEFARQLWERRKVDAKVAPAIFLDLRFVGDFATKDPDLDEIIARIIKRDWKGGPRSAPIEPKDIYQAVEQGGLVIFDGLDEVLVHLTPSQGQLFTRQLFRMRPPHAERGKLLITCRTHYFRTFKEQAGHFRLDDRDEVGGESYRALLLLPFEAGQIRTYLQNSLQREDAERAYEFISSVHNLPELARRPYTLDLITRQLTKLEEWKAAGHAVTGLTLYRFVVDEWLLRDRGKHQLTPDHKQRLMEQIAAALVRAGVRSWAAEDLEQWLMDFLEANSRVASHYHGVNRELLKEDLRTATFLVRDEEHGQFRFAHSSLQEYFLAHYLRRALEEKQAANWALRGVSPETLDFLGQSLSERPSAAAQEGLKLLRDSYQAEASELSFRYVLLAAVKNFPAPAAAGFQLPGADLFGLEVDYKGAGLLDLSNINLKGARIANSFWRNCRLTSGDFANADAARAEWHDCEIDSSKWVGAELEAGLFRRCAMAGADYEGVRLYRARWLRCSGVELEVATLSEGDQAKSLQLGHTNRVGGCAWSPDAKRILSASGDNSLKIWDAVSGECLRTLSGHTDSVNGCAWSPDGKRVVSASADGSLKIWDAASGECLRTLSRHSDSVNDCAWSPDGTRVVSASDDKSLKIWDAGSGKCLRTLSGHYESVYGCAWSPDGKRVVTASWDESLKIWDAGNGECLRTLSGHSGSVNSCAWSPDGKRVVSASGDRSLKIWDAGSGEYLRTLSGHTSSVYGCAWSPDGTRVVSASADESLKIWDAGSGECLRTLSGHAYSVSCCAWSPDGKRVVSASGDRSLKIWDAGSGECLRTLSGHAYSVSCCAWSPDGTRVASASDGNSLKIWDAGSGECLRMLTGHTNSVTGCAWSPDGTRVVSASWDKSLKIWDAGSGECLRTLSGHAHLVTGCAWSPDGTWVVSASWDESLKIWDAGSGECLRTLSGHSSFVDGSVWSPDGKRVVSASRDDSLKIWDAGSGECLGTLSGHTSSVSGCAWSPDGKRVVSASPDRSLKIWDAGNGECLRTLSGHASVVNGCAWSPDGRRVVSASYDKSLKIWDAASGECLETLSTHEIPNACEWSAQNNRITACFNDGSVRFYSADTARETGPRCYHLHDPHSEPSWAVVDPATNAVLRYGEDAWRSVGYVVPDEDGLPMWLPVETFAEPVKKL